jgi:hypothetical protein
MSRSGRAVMLVALTAAVLSTLAVSATLNVLYFSSYGQTETKALAFSALSIVADVARGGSWFMDPSGIRMAYRGNITRLKVAHVRPVGSSWSPAGHKWDTSGTQIGLI